MSVMVPVQSSVSRLDDVECPQALVFLQQAVWLVVRTQVVCASALLFPFWTSGVSKVGAE